MISALEEDIQQIVEFIADTSSCFQSTIVIWELLVKHLSFDFSLKFTIPVKKDDF
jgi:hypothetical protein